MAHEELTPLTEHILNDMGKEGSAIRRRLKAFYRERALTRQAEFEQHLEAPVLEATAQ